MELEQIENHASLPQLDKATYICDLQRNFELQASFE